MMKGKVIVFDHLTFTMFYVMEQLLAHTHRRQATPTTLVFPHVGNITYRLEYSVILTLNHTVSAAIKVTKSFKTLV